MTDWDPEDIKAAVRKRGITFASVARSIGVSPNALRLALTLPRTEAEQAIASVLDLHPMSIWPSRYHADGTRKRPQPVDNYKSVARFGNGKLVAVPHSGAPR